MSKAGATSIGSDSHRLDLRALPTDEHQVGNEGHLDGTTRGGSCKVSVGRFGGPQARG